jgi:hypothetical protein
MCLSEVFCEKKKEISMVNSYHRLKFDWRAARVACCVLLSIFVFHGISVQAADKAWAMHTIDRCCKGADGVRLGDFNGDKLPDIVTGWEESGITRMYINPGYKKVKSPWPGVTIGVTSKVEDAVFVDLDGNGVLDVVSSSEGGTRKLFVNWASDGEEKYLDAGSWLTEFIPESNSVQGWMFCVATQLDGKNGVDLIAGGKGKGEGVLGWFESPKDPHILADFKFHVISKIGWTMSIILSDMDGDGDDDVVVSDRTGPLRGCRWLENPDPGAEQLGRWKNHFIVRDKTDVMFMTIGDLDGDGFEDVVCAAGHKIVLARRLDSSGLNWKKSEIKVPIIAGSSKAVAVGDIDSSDGNEIVFTCENAGGKIGIGYFSYEDRTQGDKWILHDISGRKFGDKYDRVELIDLDGDGDLDVLTCEEDQDKDGLGVIWYENPQR